MKNILKSRFVTVVAAAAAFGLVGAGGAVAGSLVTSADIKNQTIESHDIGKSEVGKSELRADSVGPVEFNDNAVDFIRSQAGNGEDGTDGTDGQDGTNGTNGADGQDGVSGYEIHNREVGPRVNGEGYTVTVNCPAGLVALGGGVQSDNPAGTVVTGSFPVYSAANGGQATGWTGTYNLSVRTNVKAWVTCAAVN